jgi:hypothetical protein
MFCGDLAQSEININYIRSSSTFSRELQEAELLIKHLPIGFKVIFTRHMAKAGTPEDARMVASRHYNERSELLEKVGRQLSKE